MTNFTLGRIGLDADIDDVSQWDAHGETVAVSWSTPAVAEGGSIARSNAYRQMLLGYAEAVDQRFVPVTWADDPTVNGYYRVRAASVDPDPDLALEGLYYFAATLERVQGYGMPAIQTTYLFRPRTNVHSQTPEAYLAAPNLGTRWGYAYEPEDGTYSNPPTSMFPQSSEGSLGVVIASNVGGSGPSAGELALWLRNVDPEAYYVGSARLEVNGYPVEGRQVPRNWEDTWRLTNGSIELTMAASGVSNGDMVLQMRGWNGVGWTDATTVSLLGADSATPPRPEFNGPDTLTILKNTAEEVVIRLGMHVGTRSWPVFLDITCRRGIRTFACRYRRASGTGSAFPAIAVPNHLTDWGWRREGAWVKPGAYVETNYMWNPRAILDGTHWDRLLATGTATGRITGVTGVGSTGITTAFRVTATAAHSSVGFGVEQGAVGTNTPNNGLAASTQYTFAAWVRCSVTRSLNVRAQWRNSSGSVISTLDGGDVAVTANTWTRVTFTGTSPAATARVSVHVRGNSAGAAWTTGDTIDMTGLQCELGATVDADFWDGDNGASDLTIYTYAYKTGPNTQSWKFNRSGLATYWVLSPISTVQDTDGWEPDPAVNSDPPTWDFAFGMMPAGVTGDTGRYMREVASYYMSVTQTDEVVAV